MDSGMSAISERRCWYATRCRAPCGDEVPLEGPESTSVTTKRDVLRSARRPVLEVSPLPAVLRPPGSDADVVRDSAGHAALPETVDSLCVPAVTVTGGVATRSPVTADEAATAAVLVLAVLLPLLVVMPGGSGGVSTCLFCTRCSGTTPGDEQWCAWRFVRRCGPADPGSSASASLLALFVLVPVLVPVLPLVCRRGTLWWRCELFLRCRSCSATCVMGGAIGVTLDSVRVLRRLIRCASSSAAAADRVGSTAAGLSRGGKPGVLVVCGVAPSDKLM